MLTSSSRPTSLMLVPPGRGRRHDVAAPRTSRDVGGEAPEALDQPGLVNARAEVLGTHSDLSRDEVHGAFPPLGAQGLLALP